ncbi:unnamed protein product, partial [Ectocarpus fasciculatus]
HCLPHNHYCTLLASHSLFPSRHLLQQRGRTTLVQAPPPLKSTLQLQVFHPRVSVNSSTMDNWRQAKYTEINKALERIEKRAERVSRMINSSSSAHSQG